MTRLDKSGRGGLVRAAITATTAGVIGAMGHDALPILVENTPTKLANPELGYVKIAITFTAGIGQFLGHPGPGEGVVLLTLALPAGSGTPVADAIFAQFRAVMTHQQINNIAYGDLDIEPGRVAGPFWLIDASIGFTDWGQPDATTIIDASE